MNAENSHTYTIWSLVDLVRPFAFMYCRFQTELSVKESIKLLNWICWKHFLNHQWCRYTIAWEHFFSKIMSAITEQIMWPLLKNIYTSFADLHQSKRMFCSHSNRTVSLRERTIISIWWICHIFPGWSSKKLIVCSGHFNPNSLCYFLLFYVRKNYVITKICLIGIPDKWVQNSHSNLF